MWAAILAVVEAIKAFFGWQTAKNDADAARKDEQLREAKDANQQMDTAAKARAGVRDDLAVHPDRVRRDADPDARPFDPDGIG